MPYIVTKVVYPSDKVPEVAKTYLQAMEKFPSDESISVELAHGIKSTLDGMTGLTIVDVVDGKLQEAMKLISSRMVMFHSIVGFKNSVDVYYKLEEAFSLIGKSVPK
jgi:hypothetical protein